MANGKRKIDSLTQQLVDEAGQCFGPCSTADEVRFRNKIQKLLSQGNSFLDAEVESKNVTILLSDIRGFTSIAETYSALTVVDMLNRYFAKMCEVILRYGGTIDKFMGDSIMVLFGVPDSEDDDVQRALACAVEMQLAMSEINEQNTLMNMPMLYMGIGVNTGTVVVGPLGSEIHSEYTVIGDEVNLASRIEAQSLRGQVLISENTYLLAKESIEVGEPNTVQVKGKRDAVYLYELLAVREPRLMYIPRREDRKSPRVDIRMPLHFQCIDETEVVSQCYEGELLDLSYNGMLALSPIKLKPFCEIRVLTATNLLGIQSDIYARVLQCDAENENYRCSLEFTSIDESGQSTIKNVVDRLVCQL